MDFRPGQVVGTAFQRVFIDSEWDFRARSSGGEVVTMMQPTKFRHRNDPAAHPPSVD